MCPDFWRSTASWYTQTLRHALQGMQRIDPTRPLKVRHDHDLVVRPWFSLIFGCVVWARLVRLSRRVHAEMPAEQHNACIDHVRSWSRIMQLTLIRALRIHIPPQKVITLLNPPNLRNGVSNHLLRRYLDHLGSLGGYFMHLDRSRRRQNQTELNANDYQALNTAPKRDIENIPFVGSLVDHETGRFGIAKAVPPWMNLSPWIWASRSQSPKTPSQGGSSCSWWRLYGKWSWLPWRSKG